MTQLESVITNMEREFRRIGYLGKGAHKCAPCFQINAVEVIWLWDYVPKYSYCAWKLERMLSSVSGREVRVTNPDGARDMNTIVFSSRDEIEKIWNRNATYSA